MPTESVAFLFTDMVGSTELYQSVPPDVGDELRRSHLAILRNATAGTGGREVKNLGDGIMAVFPSASAALATATAMQQAVELDNRSRQQHIGLRIGMSAGEVVHEADDYYGDAVIEAARLCALCEGGQILAAEIVRIMAGRRSLARFRSLGPVTLKGITESVRIDEVQWDPLPRGRTDIPFPARLAAVSGTTTDVVGRDEELAVLAGAAKRVIAGDGREVVMISGEPGQGKTTLVAHAAQLAFDEGACVLFGHSEEGLSTPYGLFAEAFAGYAAHAQDDAFVELVEAHGSEWSRLVPAFVERAPGLASSKATDSDAERYLLFAAAVALLSGMSRQDPIVLVLDDLQWADPGSLALLHHLTSAHDHPMRVLVTGVFRSSELGQATALRDTVAQLWRHPGISRIELGSLDVTAVESLLEGATGGTLPSGSGLAELVHRETGGNPFFVTETLRHLLDTGAIPVDSGDVRSAEDVFRKLTLPTSVREVIGARVARLGPGVGRILSTAAVIGRDFDLDLLGRATELPTEELLDALDAACADALVSEADGVTGRYTFSHALVQRTLADDVGSTRRAYLHERVAQALEDLPPEDRDARAGELAHHWVAAPRSGNVVKALQSSHRAAAVAMDSLAPGDAVLHFETALELCAAVPTGDPALEVELAIGLGTAQRQVGDPAYRETLLGAARDAADIGNVEHLVAACLANDRGFYSAVGATDAEKVDALEVALGRLGPDHPNRALVLATLCSELTHGSALDRRRQLAEEAIAIAEASGDEAVLVRVLNHLHVPLQVPSMLEVIEARSVEGLRRAERVGDPVLIFWAAQWRLESAARHGNLEEMDRCLAIHGQMAEALEQPVFAWGHAFVRSLRAQIAGDVDLAERLAGEAFRIGTEGGQPDAGLIFGAQMNIVAGQRGMQHELIPLIEQMAQGTPDIPRLFFASLLAKAHVEGGEMEKASAYLAEFAAAGYDLPMDQVWLTGMVDFAEAAIECGDAVHSAALFERLEPYAGQLPATGASALGPVSHYLGGLATVVGQLDRAETFFEQSAALCRRMAATYFAARTKLLWGRMLLRRWGPDDTGRARQMLTEARDVAAARSYGGVERQAAASLASIEATA